MIDLFRDGTEYRRMTAEETAAEKTAAGAAAASAGDADGANARKDGLSNKKDDINPEFSWKFLLHLLKKGFVRYFIDAFTGMSQGMF